MIYLSQLLGNPVYDVEGERIGRVTDLGIATGEVFPRVTALAVEGPGRTPLMISWRKYVDAFDEDEISLKVVATDIRFSYLQPEASNTPRSRKYTHTPESFPVCQMGPRYKKVHRF